MEIAGSKIEVHAAQNHFHLQLALRLNEAARVHVRLFAILLNPNGAEAIDVDQSVDHQPLDRAWRGSSPGNYPEVDLISGVPQSVPASLVVL